MRWSGKMILRFLKGQGGFSLIETLVAASILAAIGVVFMTAMYTGYRSVGIVDEKLQAETLARSQLEDIKNSTYQDSGIYPVTVQCPSRYSIVIPHAVPPTCIGTAGNCTPLVGVTTIQEITVDVYHGNKRVLSVACYKVKPTM